MAAVACEHLTTQQAMANLAMTTQIAEECRLRYGHAYLVFIYKKMARKAWASRTRSGDIFTTEVTSEDKQIVDMTTSRLTIVMGHVALTDGGRFSSSHRSVATAVAQTAAESALAKKQAAADAMRRRAEQASKDLPKTANVP